MIAVKYKLVVYPLPKMLRRNGLNLRGDVVWIVVVCVVESLYISKLVVSGLIVVGELVTQSGPRIRPNNPSPLCTQDKGPNAATSLGDVIVASTSCFGIITSDFDVLVGVPVV